MRKELEIMLKSYDYLRQEILNSINWQNRLIIAEATIISALLGFGLTQIQGLVVAIPPAVIALTAFWLVEQSRMMRAGDYLQLLEDEINIKAGGAYIFWENWERGNVAGNIHIIHHLAQYLGVFGVFGVFYGVSVFSLWKLWDEWKLKDNLNPSNLELWLWGLYIVLLVALVWPIILSIQHRPRERDEFKRWKKDKYWQKRLKQPPQQQ